MKLIKLFVAVSALFYACCEASQCYYPDSSNATDWNYVACTSRAIFLFSKWPNAEPSRRHLQRLLHPGGQGTRCLLARWPVLVFRPAKPRLLCISRSVHGRVVHQARVQHLLHHG